MNITSEPVKWFDLVTACGLADVNAVSLQALLARSGSGRSGPLSVAQAAKDLVPNFENTYGRTLVPLHEQGQDGPIRRLIDEAEASARTVNAERRWPSEPLRPHAL